MVTGHPTQTLPTPSPTIIQTLSLDSDHPISDHFRFRPLNSGPLVQTHLDSDSDLLNSDPSRFKPLPTKTPGQGRPLDNSDTP